MRETVAAVVVAALLGVACETRTSTSAPAAAQATSPAPTTVAPARVAAPAGSSRPDGKVHKVTRVAKARSAEKVTRGTEKSPRETGAVEPSAPALTLSQSRPSSY